MLLAACCGEEIMVTDWGNYRFFADFFLNFAGLKKMYINRIAEK